MNKTYDRFDASKWRLQHNSGARKNPRIEMVVPLAAEVLTVGMTRGSVIEILGPPELAQTHSDIYDLGTSPFGVDYERYVIEYDENALVKRYYLQRR